LIFGPTHQRVWQREPTTSTAAWYSQHFGWHSQLSRPLPPRSTPSPAPQVMSAVLRLAALSALASVALAHVDINFPLVSSILHVSSAAKDPYLTRRLHQGTWTHTEEQQEEGGVCGGGSRVAGVAWGVQSAFVSLSGDEGNSVRVLLASTNSTTADTEIADASSFVSPFPLLCWSAQTLTSTSKPAHRTCRERHFLLVGQPLPSPFAARRLRLRQSRYSLCRGYR